MNSVTFKRSTLQVNGVDLSLLECGAGEPDLVFLHYWGGAARTWAGVMHHLADRHRCIAIDFRGWGESSKDAQDHSLETLASDVLEVLRARDLGNVVLIGHSMGGKVAQLVAARNPGLSGLVLYAPAPPTPLAVPEEDRNGFIELYQTRQGAEMVVRNLTPHALSESAREQIIEDTLRGAPAAKRAWPMQGMVEDITSQTSRVSVPIAIIAGGDDPVEPAASLRKAFAVAGLAPPIVCLPGVGHIAPLEDPAGLAKAIGDATRVIA